ncbi:hypothetical protein OX284_007735 [Flavobacterium sp. SUN046]|uniref:hypothetical protein n=1 Tax=Flavobacterium sp. SUN046 TaxID=3002440 RepID=UPI002DB8301B|nr:hypothetical protein [Flavobacterium sp. SUN046]MEC4049318.1 hypothetical protein [Flavobacterium sp. SUN046]
MKAITRLLSKVYFSTKNFLNSIVTFKKPESAMTVDEYIESVKNRKQELSSIYFTVEVNNPQDLKDDSEGLEDADCLVLA